MKYFRALLYMLSTLLFYLGLTLVGWGLDDIPGFFSMPPRLGYSVVVLLFSLAIGYQAIDTPEAISGSKGDESRLVHRQLVLGQVLVIILYAAMYLLPFFDQRGIAILDVGQAFRWLGTGLCAFGYLLIFWSGWALGRMYSPHVTIQPDHQLITSGPYQVIRHPRYLGVLLLSLGMSCLFRSWVGLLMIVPVAAILLPRINDEEALLKAEFGPGWQDYCQKTWKLLPYIY